MNLLDAFLKRCEIHVEDADAIPYRIFLEKFQTRNEDGITHKAIAGYGFVKIFEKKTNFSLYKMFNLKAIKPIASTRQSFIWKRI
jgi:hypothetical protein